MSGAHQLPPSGVWTTKGGEELSTGPPTASCHCCQGRGQEQGEDWVRDRPEARRNAESLDLRDTAPGSRRPRDPLSYLGSLGILCLPGPT